MSFATWEKQIEVIKEKIPDATYNSGTTYTVYSETFEGHYYVNFCPRIVGADELTSVACKVGSRLDTDLENLVAFFKTSPTAYNNPIYEQICLSGVYISDGAPLEMKIEVAVANNDDWYLEHLNTASYNVSLLKLA